MDCELQSILIFHFDITIRFGYFAEHFNLTFTKFSYQFAMQLNTVIICYSLGLKLAVCKWSSLLQYTPFYIRIIS